MRRLTILLLALVALGLLSLVPAAPPASADPGVTEVDVGLYLINFGNYDVSKGTYVMDFYLWFSWDTNASGPSFTPTTFEFMNGRPTSKEQLSDETAPDGQRTIWFRIQASLTSEPRFRNFPFDEQVLQVQFEDTAKTVSTLQYRPLLDDSGLDPAVRVSGWRIEGWSMTTRDVDYPWGETYHRTVFEIRVVREPTTTAIKTLLPVLVFCAVSGLSFFFPVEKITQRVGLGTGMLISAVMFHISQTSALPPLGSLILMDKIMISAYTFLAASLVVTTIISINEDHWKKPGLSKWINGTGATAALIVPFVVFGLLTLV